LLQCRDKLFLEEIVTGYSWHLRRRVSWRCLSTKAPRFEDFLVNILLLECGRYPAKNSVIVMDNASIHHSERIRQLCTDAGVTLVYLSPYSPDYNPIEEFFSELKAFVKKYWRLYLDTTDRSHGAFRSFLGFCVLEVGKRKKSAQVNAGIPCDG
jgi:transposase